MGKFLSICEILWANDGKIFKNGKKIGVTNPCNSLIFKSGQKDSNLRPPAPKAGALAGLRHTPKQKTMRKHRLLCCGEGGIRTPGTPCGIRQFSKLLVSATHPPLQVRIAGAKILLLCLSATFFMKNFQVFS